MNERVKRFIEKYIDKISSNEFESLYFLANHEFVHTGDVGGLTSSLLTAGIDPLQYMKQMPSGYYDGFEGAEIPSISKTVTEIHSEAFFNSDIVSLTIPGTIKTLHQNAIDYACDLQTAVLEDGVEYLGRYCFNDCSELEFLSLPATINIIEAEAFIRCRNLVEIEFRGSIEQWEAIEKSMLAFENCYVQTVKCTDGDVEL